jgi:hypothetical protein
MFLSSAYFLNVPPPSDKVLKLFLTRVIFFFSSLSLSHTENINLLDPNLKIPEMKTVVHYITKITKGNLKQFKKAICEYCSHLVVFNNAQTLNSHIFDEHSGYFKEITEKFYYYADQLAEERFKMAVEELKSEIAGQELFVIFLNPSLKV